MISERKHWIEICKLVAEKSLFIFPEIKSKKLKSEIISNLFETQTEKYFKSVGIEIRGCSSDREPDLYDVLNEKPYEIKVTGVNDCVVNECKWMGGKYSKRPSDYFLIMWNQHNTFEGEKISFNVTHCYIDQTEWNEVDGGNQTYYATVFKSSQIFDKEYKSLIGNATKQTMTLECF